jgi:hypothetical protein
MFNFGKKEDDPQKAMENARKTVNDGLMGGLTKAFMGQEFVDKVNNALDGAQEAQWVAQSGLEASAEVMAIQDTGATVNDNPVVMLTLKVTSSVGTQFDTTGRTMVSRIAIPRVGDKIKIKYNPADPTQIAVL